MLTRGLKLTSQRRAILVALSPGQGTHPDELRRKVALHRGLDPSSPRWPSFGVSFARSLRILEEKGAVEVRRETVLFRKPCMSWVALTAAGERERARARDAPLGALEPERALLGEIGPLLRGASDRDLEDLEALLAAERARRAERLPRG